MTRRVGGVEVRRARLRVQESAMPQIREATPADFEAIAQILSKVWPESPIDPADLLRDYETLEPHQQTRFAIAIEDQQPVAVCELFRDVGTYHPQRWTAVVSVVPDLRGRGVGTALYNWLKGVLSHAEVESIESRMREDDPIAFAFAARRGFHETKRDFVSELDLGTCQVPTVGPPKGIEIHSFAHVDSPEMRARLHETFEEVRADVPRTYPPTRTPFPFFDEHVLGDPSFLPEATFLAMANGDIAGFTGAFHAAEAGVVDQWLTGVRRPWRGKGLALALKLEGIRWAQANGYRLIRTDNDSRNTRMLGINERLGFVRRCGLIRLRWCPEAD